MIVQIDSDTGDGRFIGQAPTLVYGTELELWLRVRDREMASVDVEGLGCSFWTASVVPNLGTSEKALAVSVMRENVARGDAVGVHGLSLASVEAYKFVAGRLRAPAFLCVYGYIAEGDPTALFRMNLPVCLQASSTALRPVDVSTALLRRLEEGANDARAHGDAAASSAASAARCAEDACACAASAAADASDARAAMEEIMTHGGYSREEIDSILGSVGWFDL